MNDQISLYYIKKETHFQKLKFKFKILPIWNFSKRIP